MASEPITYATLNLYAKIDGEEYIVGQIQAPVQIDYKPGAKTIRDGIQFVLGKVKVLENLGWDEKSIKAEKAVDKWRKDVEAELNAS